eukprot:2568848-Alexandrium_andersonii.AAC.1
MATTAECAFGHNSQRALPNCAASGAGRTSAPGTRAPAPMLRLTAGASKTTGAKVSPAMPSPTAATGRQLPKAASWSPSTAASCARGTDSP